MRLAPLVLVAALAVGCTSSLTPSTPPPLTTQPLPTTTMSAAERAEREAAGEATKQLLKDMNKTTPTRAAPATTRRPTTTLSEYERDFDNCKLLNNTILSVSDDYYAGEVDAHTGLGSIRLALETMEALDCGRFSSVVAREMANMDQALRSVGY